jgi:hypothetical protein
MDMIWDDDAWRDGSSKLVALAGMKVPTDFIDMHTVEHFHEIIDLFEKATQKVFSSYRIDPARFKKKPVETGSPLQPYVWSKEKFCPAMYFRQQVNGFTNCIVLFKQAVIAQHNDIAQQMEEMKKQMGGESNEPRPQPSPVNISIGSMTNSPFMVHSPGATIINKTEAGDPEFPKLIKQIKDALPSLKLEPQKEKQISADITTIEVQLESPAPKYTVITESFNSMHAILEGLAANVISAGLMAAINAYLNRFSPF